MEASFWHNKWETKQIGFHQDQATPLLVSHINKLKLEIGARVFLPLCGKTLDIAYLMSLGYQVAGIELSEIAIKELFTELDIVPEVISLGSLILYKAKGIDIYVGDFFDLEAETLGEVDAIYDRASLIALPPVTRIRYSQHLVKISHTAPQLIVCLEYDQLIMKGPPFSIPPSEIQQHYEAKYDYSCVESISLAEGLKGQYPAKDSAWILSALNS